MITANRFTNYNKTFTDIKNNLKDNTNIFRAQKKGNKITLFAGIDDGFYAISIIGDNLDIETNSTSLIEVVKKRNEHQNLAYFFRLLDENLLSIFISFAIDLESVLDSNPNITIIEIYNRYLYWQKMFKVENENISLAKIKGLINELLILNKYLIPKYGLIPAIEGWIGFNGTKKDFAYADGSWYEAKATEVGKQSVRISSLDQLNSKNEGFLVTSKFETTSAQNSMGVRLIDVANDLINRVLTNDIKLEIYNKISSVGIPITCISDEKHIVNKNRFLIHDISFYRVNDQFPIIKNEQLPTAVVNVKYDLLLSQIEEFKVNL